MTSGLFVWAGGRWCEVDAASGRVRGWRRRARFVYRAGGKLQLASTAAVLRGLRALLAGSPTTVRDSAPLSQRRQIQHSLLKNPACTACKQHRHRCAGEHNTSFSNNYAESHKQRLREDPKPSPAKVDTAVQVTLPPRSQGSPPRRPPAPPAASQRSVTPRAPRRSSSSEPQVSVRRQVAADIHRSGSVLKQASQDSVIPLAQKQPCKLGASVNSQLGHCKELVINEQDVDLYRSYLLEHDPHFDVYRFDSDEGYKLSVFFKINPLVNIERCARIERMLRASQSSQEMSLKDFATKLGLRSISEQEDTIARYKMRRRAEKIVRELSSDGTDKENQLAKVKRDYLSFKSRRKVLEESKETEKGNQPVLRTRKKLYSQSLLSSRSMLQLSKRRRVSETTDKESATSSEGGKGNRDAGWRASHTSDSDFVKKPRSLAQRTAPVKKFPIKFALPKPIVRAPPRALKSYSSLEDQAIVSWVSCGPRARQVNGNRVWRELQAQYQRLTGTSRTWHSLRNRYLRYILPALPALALPPPHAARLRADAAKGELKSKARVPRRNSMFAQPRVRSAFAPRRRQPLHDDSGSPEPPARTLRSSAAHASPTRQDNKLTDKQSDNTQPGDKVRETKHTQELKRSSDKPNTNELKSDSSDKLKNRPKPGENKDVLAKTRSSRSKLPDSIDIENISEIVASSKSSERVGKRMRSSDSESEPFRPSNKSLRRIQRNRLADGGLARSKDKRNKPRDESRDRSKEKSRDASDVRSKAKPRDESYGTAKERSRHASDVRSKKKPRDTSEDRSKEKSRDASDDRSKVKTRDKLRDASDVRSKEKPQDAKKKPRDTSEDRSKDNSQAKESRSSRTRLANGQFISSKKNDKMKKLQNKLQMLRVDDEDDWSESTEGLIKVLKMLDARNKKIVQSSDKRSSLRNRPTELEDGKDGSDDRRTSLRDRRQLDDNRDQSDDRRTSLRDRRQLDDNRDQSDDRRTSLRDRRQLDDNRDQSDDRRTSLRDRRQLDDNRDQSDDRRTSLRDRRQLDDNRDQSDDRRTSLRDRRQLDDNRDQSEDRRTSLRVRDKSENKKDLETRKEKRKSKVGSRVAREKRTEDHTDSSGEEWDSPARSDGAEQSDSSSEQSDFVNQSDDSMELFEDRRKSSKKKRGRPSRRDTRTKQRDRSNDRRDVSDDRRTSLRGRPSKYIRDRLESERKSGQRDDSDESRDRSQTRLKRQESDHRRPTPNHRQDKRSDSDDSPSRDHSRQGKSGHGRDESEERRSRLRSRPSDAGRASRTPTYDQLTRQFARIRSTPNPPQVNAQKTKLRKLYNPNAVLR